MKMNNNLCLSKVCLLVIYSLGLACSFSAKSVASNVITFNTDVLSDAEKKSIDISSFSTSGYVPPGTYDFKIKINKNVVDNFNVTYYPFEGEEKSAPCMPMEAVERMGFKQDTLKMLKPWKNEGCTNLSELPGLTFKADMKEGILYITAPNEYLEYTDDNWAPSSMWDDGIPGAFVDYNANAYASKSPQDNNVNSSITGYGTVGLNAGPWRGRADWQANEGTGGQKKLQWNQTYAFRAIATIGAKLTLGGTFSSSDVFDSIKFVGLGLMSDDKMLAPNLRGYAPQVNGVAKTNAKVTVSQQNRVIYETQVSAGPFTISELSQGVYGDLDVKVQEQDGSVQTFKVSTANIPYLSRPGSLRYKVYAGKTKDNGSDRNDTEFSQAEFSYGLSNTWSLYGGSVLSKDYKSLAIGFGRDLFAFGALALDVTQSRASVKNEDYEGRSYRLSYAKRFDSTGSQITFAGYRFSEKNYMSFNDFLNVVSAPDNVRKSKNMYTITLSQQLEQLGLSLYLQYTRENYWNDEKEERYSMSLARNFDIGKMRGLSAYLSAYQNKYGSLNDNGVSTSVSIPLGDGAHVRTESSVNNNTSTYRVGYSDNLKNGDNYSLSTGLTGDKSESSAFYSHSGDYADITTNASYRQDEYSSAGMSIRGGMTATTKGAALHRTRGAGASRMLIDTGDASDIPVRAFGDDAETNWFGKAVVPDVSDYSRTRLSVNVKSLPDNAEVSNSVDNAYLTEGAIGYRKFSVLVGEKIYALIRLSDNSQPPFGAVVKNEDGQEVGMVSDNGEAYLSGVVPGKRMRVFWDSAEQCAVLIPPKLNVTAGNILLPCIK
ncbi:fimbria/pilus outer membrane usher protein [Lelliottia sp. SL45]|uniref:fimbria/pilus outer membrane usher protein n=1 Tax=Lelliottia sp. SL45 TaxID=2994665 RepID=UPI0022738440|nr:fimbria/pilus outer membrane usher protein [Lelliottia sp. SL45]MCY1700957.1 fimbria/pilus outer membrane usher protein [Lelliottia sp. SL45]